MPSTNRIYGGEKIFLTPEERADMLRGASDQFMTDITYLPRYLQEFIARPTPLTPGEMRNPQQGTLESLRADNRQWDEFQQGQPAAYQQGRSLGTAGAVVADPLNYMTQAVPVVKGVGRLANMVAREAATPQGLRAMTNALTNQRGMFVPPTGEEMNALLRMAKGEDVKEVPWVWSELTDRMPRTEISDAETLIKGTMPAGEMIPHKWQFNTLNRNPKAATAETQDILRHPELFIREQGTGNIPILPKDGSGASLSRGLAGFDGNVIEMGRGYAGQEIKAPLLHELQHAVQERGGWARGGSPEQFDPKNAEQARDVLSWRKEVERWMDDNWPNSQRDSEAFRNADQRLRNEYQNIGAYDMVPPAEIRDQALSHNFKKGSEQRAKLESLVKEYGLDKRVTAPSQQEMYRRLAGEEEARRTATRAPMTMAERYGNPYKGTDIQDPRDLIVTRGGGNALSTNIDEYGGYHRPLTKEGGASTLDDLEPAFGEDIYGSSALQYFGSGDPREKNVLRILKSVRGNPNAKVTIYRGVPEGNETINAGDWVTLDRNVAEDYGKVVSKQVPASHITSWADSLLEFGYHPPKGAK